jgi:PKD repeat protein
VNFQIKDAASGNLVALTGGLGIFTYSVRVGQPLSFEPTGTYSSYLWEFGDGETSTQAQAQHAYAAEGQRAVTLTVEGNSSCKKTYSVTAAGNSGAFTAAYEDSSSFGRFEVTAFKNIVFSALDLPSQVDSYAWEFSDGFTATIPNPAHAFSATAGTANVTHTVKLTVTREAQSVSTTQSFTVISPPEPPKWFVGGLAYATGSIEGTVWQTDVTILNPDPTLPATYSLAFLDGRKVVDPKDLVFKPVTLAAQQTMTSSNILGEFFEQPLGSFGALIVRGDVAPAPPTITSRTFNNGDPTKGSFGLSVPSTHTSNGGPPQGSAAPQLLIGLRDDDVAYTNIGLVNLISSDWSHAHLTFFDAAGATLGLLNVDVPPYGVAQLNKPLTSPDGLGLVSSALYRVQVTVEPGGSVYPYATVIDRKSTDPSIVTPADAPSNAYLIPGIVRQTGRNGERFRSRVTVSNTSDVVRTVRITLGYVRCDEGGCGNADTVVGDVRINPGQTQSWDDFVKVWLGHFKLTDVSDTEDYKNSYVDVRPVPEDAGTDPLIVLGETYNETPNGSTSSGRVGFQIPGYTPADGAGTAAANKRLVLTGLASTATYRTNIALFPVAGATGKWCNVHVYSQEGTKLRDIDVPVGAFTSVDNATLFGDLPGERFSIVIDNIDDGITLGGYATVIDNTSGDATFVKAQPAL